MKKLCLTFLLIALSFPAYAAQVMSAIEAAKKSSANEITLIDIRRPQEWQQTGVAPSAHTVSMHQRGFLERLTQLVNGKKDTPIALICAAGVRSSWLAGELENRGYTNIINVREGMMGSRDGPGWIKRGLPVK